MKTDDGINGMALAKRQQVREIQSRDGRWRIWLARAGWLLVFVLVTAIFLESAPSATVYERRGWRFTEALPAVWPYMSTFTFAAIVVAARAISLAIFYAVALLIALRKWNDWFALFVSAALLMVAWGFVARGDTSTYFFPTWFEPVEPALSTIMQFVFLLSWVLLFFLLPDGRFVPHWSAWFVALPFLGAIPLFALDYFIRTIAPQYRELAGGFAWSMFIILFLTAITAGLFSQIYRYQNIATPTQRQQMKWILFGLAVQPLPILSGTGGIAGSGPWSSLFNLFFELIIVTLLPVSIGLAVFRRRLWDVDPLINRSVVYGGLTAFILILYGLIVGGTSTLFQTHDASAPMLIAAVGAAFLVPVIYRRLNQAVNRVYPVTVSPETTRPGLIDMPGSPFDTVLQGRRLTLTRLGWGVATGLSLIVFVAGMRASLSTSLFSRMPELAGRYDIAMFRIFAGNQFLASEWVLTMAVVQLITFLIVGFLLFWRRSNDWLAILASMMCITVGVGFSPNTIFLPVLWPAWQGATTAQQILTFGSLVLILLVFPNGRFVPHWTRALAVGWLLYSITWFVWPELNPHQSSLSVALLIFISAAGFGLVSQLFRYRHVSNSVERQQSKWVLTGFLTTHACFFLLVTLSVAGITPRLDQIAPLPVRLLNTVFGLTAILIPISIAFAIFRYRLWDIDLFINRAIVYGSLTALIVIFYATVVGVLGTIFRFENNLMLSVLATGLIAVLFNPIRVRLQRAVNHLLYGDRDDPITVLSELGRQMEHSAAPGDTLSTLVENISRSLKLPYVAITLGVERNDQVVAAAGIPTPDVLRLPLAYQSQPMGELLVGQRSPGEMFALKERQLLNNIARQAGAAVYAAQLTDHLQHSREQLVLAREEERRRLQRDLHDGLGPQLASLSMQLEVARNLVGADSAEAISLLAKLSAETNMAIADIRRLVYDLRPLSLDQLGLAGALQEFVAGQPNGTGPRVTLDAPPDLPPLPAAIEVAAFRIVQEAVTNCLRHARANQCHVRLAVNGELILEIRDDGQGLRDKNMSGVGLASMRERAAELGGECWIESLPRGGTRVTATFPLPKDFPQ
jgi:signal transduction histidine kinase